jgi:hypothetical protein
MATRSLNVLISGDPKPLGIASKQAEGHIKGVEGAGVRMGKTLALGFAGRRRRAAGALVVGLKKSVDAAKEAEVSQAKLKAQLKASGISYRAHAKEIDAVIQKHSQLAGVDDEDLQDAFTNLVRATGSVSKSMHDMGLVTDIARAKHIDVAKAADLLGKVHAGNTAVLKRYGIAFDPVTKAQDKLKDSNVKATAEQVKAAKAADKARRRRRRSRSCRSGSGAGRGVRQDGGGRADRFHVALENVEEKLGKGLLPVLAKVTGASRLPRWHRLRQGRGRPVREHVSTRSTRSGPSSATSSRPFAATSPRTARTSRASSRLSAGRRVREDDVAGDAAADRPPDDRRDQADRAGPPT